MRFPSFVDVSRGNEVPAGKLLLTAIRYIAEKENLNDPEAYSLLVERANKPKEDVEAHGDE